MNEEIKNTDKESGEIGEVLTEIIGLIENFDPGAENKNEE